jgi:hypothetical protein
MAILLWSLFLIETVYMWRRMHCAISPSHAGRVFAQECRYRERENGKAVTIFTQAISKAVLYDKNAIYIILLLAHTPGSLKTVKHFGPIW